MKIAFLFLLTGFLIACNADKQKATLSPSNLESFYVTIDPSYDTVLRTPGGAAIQIKKGTFATEQELEIKEAYTMKEMILAGLVTESNGAPLRSGGMIYINTKAGDEVALQKPITVLLPTNGIEAGMQLFKGEVTGDSVNWVATDTLQPTVSEAMLMNGKAVYVNNCMPCHNINRNLTGPALSSVTYRGPWKEFGNIVRWVHNPGSFIPTTAYTRQLARQYNGQVMPSFPLLSEYDIACVMSFINNESQKMITDTFRLPQPYSALDSSYDISFDTIYERPCGDTTYYSEQDTLSLSDEYVTAMLDGPSETGNAIFPELRDTTLLNPATQSMRQGFTDMRTSDGAYRFEIKTLGWYNVDAFVAGLPGTTLCKLDVTLGGTGTSEGINVYAFFPEQKNLSVGIREKTGHYKFEKVGDKIPLYLNEKGIVLAFGNRGDQFYYGTTSFKVKEAQTVLAELQPATEESFLDAIKAEKIEGINLDVTRQKMKVVPCAGDSSQLVN